MDLQFIVDTEPLGRNSGYTSKTCSKMAGIDRVIPELESRPTLGIRWPELFWKQIFIWETLINKVIFIYLSNIPDKLIKMGRTKAINLKNYPIFMSRLSKMVPLTTLFFFNKSILHCKSTERWISRRWIWICRNTISRIMLHSSNKYVQCHWTEFKTCIFHIIV